MVDRSIANEEFFYGCLIIYFSEFVLNIAIFLANIVDICGI